MTSEQLDTILNFFKDDHNSIVKKTREEWEELPKNPIFGHLDVYNACRNELLLEKYIDSHGLTPKGNRFIGFVKEEEKRVEKEKKEEEMYDYARKTFWYTKKNFWISIIAAVLAALGLIKCNNLWPDSSDNSKKIDSIAQQIVPEQKMPLRYLNNNLDLNIKINSPDTIKTKSEFFASITINPKYKLVNAYTNCNIADNATVDTLKNEISGCNNLLIVEHDSVKIWFTSGSRKGKFNFEEITILAKGLDNKYYYNKCSFDYWVK
ncbi:MAG: hypothetical protein Q8M29_12665 [Bacteroidota bacterium]|nr:hypothetical protein [Bacteroidota bacterium]